MIHLIHILIRLIHVLVCMINIGNWIVKLNLLSPKIIVRKVVRNNPQMIKCMIMLLLHGCILMQAAIEKMCSD
jgi:hypothetical protein